MSAAAWWSVGGLTLAALEMVVPGFFLLWIGLGAIGTGAATGVLDLGAHAQLSVFIVLTAVLICVVAVRMLKRRNPDLVNAPGMGLIGQMCRAIDFRDGEGRVSLGDGTWPARMPGALRHGDEQPANGTPLKVIGLEGTTLLVAAND
jgi:membrane protein implicated in regulation of membrane protease activity